MNVHNPTGRPGQITTITESQDHTEWPCVPKGHPKDVSCEDAIASYAVSRGAVVIRAGSGERT